MTTTQQYLELLRNLLPPGAAWPTEDDSDLTRLLSAMADELARIHRRALELLEEADPRTTFELLDDFERMLGLPDECTDVIDNIQERRDAIVQRLTSTGGQSIAYFLGIAEAIGYEGVTIEEYDPFECGESQCGEPLNGPSAVRYEWRLQVPGARVTEFVAGASECGDPLGDIDRAEDLECLLSRLKPAHTHLIFAYEGV